MRGGDCMGGAAVRSGLSCTKCNSHPSTASIPITVLPYGPLLCGFNMPIKYLLTSIHTNRRLQQSWRSSYMRRSKVIKVCRCVVRWFIVWICRMLVTRSTTPAGTRAPAVILILPSRGPDWSCPVLSPVVSTSLIRRLIRAHLAYTRLLLPLTIRQLGYISLVVKLLSNFSFLQILGHVTSLIN